MSLLISETLEQRFNISSDDIQKARSYQSKFSGRLEHILVNMGSLSEEQLPAVYAHCLKLPLLDDSRLQELQSEELQSSPWASECTQHSWVLLYADGKKCTFAALDPLNPVMNNWLYHNQIDASIYVATSSQINALSTLFSDVDEDIESGELLSSEEEKLKELASEAPIVNLLNALIARALREGASDMHLEPYDGYYRARFRVDGVLHESESIPLNKQLPIVTRLKILSGMDIAERRRPQDGKIEMKIANQEIDIRVSALPLNDGESIVMRFLKKESVQYDMSVLGLSPDIQSSIMQDIKKTSGVVLLTGPTGSGKTTTLYTFLNALNNEDVKIVTLEDPVEYQLEGINQVQVNSEIGFDFAAGLRSIVRQDPDVIMLGEIRDKETAQIALQSALTGHLVFSTVHTNDAASAYTRLLDLGVEEFLLNAALVSVVAQRLARKVCPHCATEHPDSTALISQYKLDELARSNGLAEITLKKGSGCESCGFTGYKGRLAITEYLACDNDIKAVPKDAEFIQKAKQINADKNRRTLLQDGLYKAIQGQTTIDEVIRVAG